MVNGRPAPPRPPSWVCVREPPGSARCCGHCRGTGLAVVRVGRRVLAFRSAGAVRRVLGEAGTLEGRCHGEESQRERGCSARTGGLPPHPRPRGPSSSPSPLCSLPRENRTVSLGDDRGGGTGEGGSARASSSQGWAPGSRSAAGPSLIGDGGAAGAAELASGPGRGLGRCRGHSRNADRPDPCDRVLVTGQRCCWVEAELGGALGCRPCCIRESPDGRTWHTSPLPLPALSGITVCPPCGTPRPRRPTGSRVRWDSLLLPRGGTFMLLFFPRERHHPLGWRLLTHKL